MVSVALSYWNQCRDVIQPVPLIRRRSDVSGRVSTWCIPPPRVVKINTDASFDESAGTASMAVIIRNEYGKVFVWSFVIFGKEERGIEFLCCSVKH